MTSTAIGPPARPPLTPPPPAGPTVPVATGAGKPASAGHVAETGVWIGIGTISMVFAALTSALVVRQSGAPDWRHLHLPTLLYINTLVLVASSLTLESARRRLTPAGLYVAIGLGLLFVVGQVLAWSQLAAQQVLLAGGGGPSSAFFYVFTALHAAHVLGGLGGLVYVQRRLVTGVLSAPTFMAAGLYWHFMAILWLYLLALLTLRA